MTTPLSKQPGERHEAWLQRLVRAATVRDARAGSGDMMDFSMTLARIVYRETRRALLQHEAAERTGPARRRRSRPRTDHA